MVDWHSQIRSFEIYLRLEKGVSDHTLQAYLHDIKLMVSFLESRSPILFPTEVKYTNIQEFIVRINELGLSSASQNRIISGIRAFYRYLLIEDLIETDPTELIDMPRQTQKLPDVLSDEEVNLLLDAIDKSTPDGMRNSVMIETMYGCGLRVSELIQLKLSDIFVEEEYIMVTGKGNKQRLIPINKRALYLIQIYIKEIRSMIPIKKGNENFVFINRLGTKISRISVFQCIKKAAQKANLQKEISPHTFRHSFATELVLNGADLRAVQEMLGHASITTTEIYTHLNRGFLRETLQKYHPSFGAKSNKEE